MMARIYRLLVGAAGLVLLGLSLTNLPSPQPWLTIATFVALSWAVKRAGFRVVGEVTHSLVNVVDVAILLLLGPLWGALVIVASNALALLAWDRRREHWTAPELLERAVFVGGIRALIALAAGNLYLALGGALAPTSFSGADLLPLGALFVTWFGLDHLLWTGHAFAQGGKPEARRFLEAAIGPSLLIELLPLPFALLFVVSWVLFDPALRLLLAGAVLGVALVIRLLARALRDSRERLKTVSMLSEFGEAVVRSELDELHLSALLFEYVSRLVEPLHFGLALHEHGGWRAVSLAGVADPRRVERLAALAQQLPQTTVVLLLPNLSESSLRGVLSGQRPPHRGYGLIALLPGADELLGVFVVESATLMTAELAQVLALLAANVAAAVQNARHYRQEQRRALQLQTIAAVSQRVAAILDLDELLDQVVDLVKESFGYYHVQVYLVDREREEVVFRAGSGPVGDALAHHPPRFPVEDDEPGIIAWVASHAEPLLVNDVTTEPRYIRDDERLLPNTRAELAVPLKVEARVLGVLDVQSDQAGTFTSDDLFIVSTLADQVAIAIEDARLYAAQREETWVTTALLQVAEAVSTLTRLADVLETVARITPILTGASSTAVFLWREEENHFEVAQTYGIKFDALVELAQSSPAPHEFPLLAEARKQQQLVIAEDVTQSGLVPAAYCRLLAPAEAGDGHAAETGKFCLVAAPLVAQGEAVGVIVLGFPPDAPSIDERRRALIAGIAQQAAVAIMAARLYAAQRDEAWITTALLQVAEAVASRNELPELLQLISRLTLMLAEVEHCGVYLWDSTGRRLVPTQATGFPPLMETRWKETPLTAANFPALTELRVASGPLVLNGRDGGGLGAGRLNEFFGERLVASGLQARGQFLGLMVVDLAPGVRRLSERDRAILSGIARQLSIAVENAQLYEEAIENERRTQELRLARQLQTALLPERPPVVPGYQLAGYWHPAREVAGDFYDYFFLSHNRLGIVIADVADKGMAAALFMVLARSAVRESVWSEEQAGAALTRANHLVEADARGGMFVTCFLGLLSPGEGRLVVSNAGHLPPLIYDSANDSFVSFALRNLPLGILPEVRYAEAAVDLAPGSFIVLYTDGVTDAHDPQMRMFGIQRLAEAVWATRAGSADEIVAAIIEAATSFVGDEQSFDDLTVVVLKRD